jgi:flagellar basal-body rod modification protein FlgD
VAPQATTNENRDMFTKLLVAQIQNQDPLAPQDPTAYVNQLSQLSQTEALQNLSQMTTANASILQSMQTLAMGSQVGSEVTVATEYPQAGRRCGARQHPAERRQQRHLAGADRPGWPAAHDRTGRPRLRFASFTIDPDALGLPPGSYAIQAKPSDGTSPQIEVAARLNSVRVANGGVVLQVANIGEVDPSSITGFNGKTES